MLALILFLLVILIFGTALYASVKGAPWVPTWRKDVRRLLELAEIKPGEKLYDLGAGDGRLVIEAARHYQAKVVGYEFSLLFYLWGNINVFLSGLSSSAKIKFGDFYKKNLSTADVIVCFLTPWAMKRLKPKFEKELKKGARIVSYAFSIPGWRTKLVSKPEKDSVPIFLYKFD